MNSVSVTFSEDLKLACVTDHRCFLGRDEVLHWNVRTVELRDIFEISSQHYRTPKIHLGEIVLSEGERPAPILSAHDSVLILHGHNDVFWCPEYEWDEVMSALAHEQREQRELEESASHPELRIIHDNERHMDNPIIVWNGWLRKELHTFSGALPRGYEGHIIERYNPEEHYWESEYEPEATFGKLVNAQHAKKRVSA